MSIYTQAFRALFEEKVLLSKFFGSIVALTFIVLYFSHEHMGRGFALIAFLCVFAVPLLYVFLSAYFYRKYVLDKTQYPTVGESIYIAFQILIVGFIKEILVGLLTLLFIVPGIMFAVYWNFVFDELISQRSSWFHTLGASSRRVDGRWWEVFFEGIVQQIVFFFIAALVAVVCMLIFGLIKTFLPLGGLLILASAFSIGIFFLWMLWCQSVHMFYYKQCTPILTEATEDK